MRFFLAAACIAAAAACALTIPPALRNDFMTTSQALHIVGAVVAFCVATLLATL